MTGVNIFLEQTMYPAQRRRAALMVSALDSGGRGPGLGKTPYSQSVLLYPGV